MLWNKRFSQSRSAAILLLTSNVLASLPWAVVSRCFLGLSPCLLCLPVFFPKVTLLQRIVLAFGEIPTDNYVMGNVPYRTVAAELAAAPARGTARSSFMQERRGSALGPGDTRVPAGWAAAASREEGAVPLWWSLPGAHPGDATPGRLQTCAAVTFPCAPVPESALDGKAVKMVLLCLLFPRPLLSKQTHSCKRATSVFKRRHVTFQNLNFPPNRACCHLCNLLFSRSVNVALWGCASKRG